MKYQWILCTGHPRSGTHYITAIMSLNFLDDEDYLNIYRNHELPDIVTDDHTAYLYIWRRFEDVSKSIYLLKERFGLQVNSYEAFIESRYSHMWRNESPDHVVTHVRTLNQKATLNGVSDFFQEIDMTPAEYWIYYNKKWAACAEKHSNVFGICYDEMVNNFEGTMQSIALKLGSHRRRFKNINRKIGWWK